MSTDITHVWMSEKNDIKIEIGNTQYQSYLFPLEFKRQNLEYRITEQCMPYHLTFELAVKNSIHLTPSLS